MQTSPFYDLFCRNLVPRFCARKVQRTSSSLFIQNPKLILSLNKAFLRRLIVPNRRLAWVFFDPLALRIHLAHIVLRERMLPRRLFIQFKGAFVVNFHPLAKPVHGRQVVECGGIVGFNRHFVPFYSFGKVSLLAPPEMVHDRNAVLRRRMALFGEFLEFTQGADVITFLRRFYRTL